MKRIVFLYMIILCFGLHNAEANVTFSGGGTYDIDYLIDDTVEVWDATLNILPGAVVTGIFYMCYSAQVNMYGGHLEDRFWAISNSQANIYGGFIGLGKGLQLYACFISNSVFNIYGKNFNYPYGPIPETVDCTEGTLTGTLHMGEDISWTFKYPNSADIILHEMEVIPVPGSCIMAGLGIGLVSWLRRCRTL